MPRLRLGCCATLLFPAAVLTALSGPQEPAGGPFIPHSVTGRSIAYDPPKYRPLPPRDHDGSDDPDDHDDAPVYGKQTRIMKITNQCPFPIRVQGTGGAAYSLTCSVDADCPTGLVCDPSVARPGGKKGGCYFKLPKPADNGGSFNLMVNRSMSIKLPTTVVPYKDTVDHPQEQSWNGNIYASTGCKGLPGGTHENCQTGICYHDTASGFGSPGICEGSLGPNGPATRIEMSLQQGPGHDYSGYDFYDVTMLDGVNIPATIRPIGAKSADCPSDDADFCRYWCGAPGATKASHTDLADCSWEFDPSRDEGLGDLSPYLKWVDANLDGADGAATASSPPHQRCNSDSDCTVPGEVCGFLGQTNSHDKPMALGWGKQCGRQIGWMVANGACKWTAAWSKAIKSSDGIDGFQAPYHCKTPAGVDTYQNLYGCEGGFLSSGYRNGASPNTCGCPDWGNLPTGGIKAPNSNMQCQPLTTTNVSGSPWTYRALPFAAILKRGCPTAYSFPFDDASSTFQCRSEVGKDNLQSYEITFCPDGKTGLGKPHYYACTAGNTCVKVPSGTPGAYAGLAECQAACGGVPPTPATPAPPQPPPTPATPAPQPTPVTPQPPSAAWVCSPTTGDCDPMPVGTPGGYPSWADCYVICPLPAPPTPAPPAPFTPAPPPGEYWLCGALSRQCLPVPDAIPGVTHPTKAECVAECSGIPPTNAPEPSPAPTPAPPPPTPAPTDAPADGWWLCGAATRSCIRLPVRIDWAYPSKAECQLHCSASSETASPTPVPKCSAGIKSSDGNVCCPMSCGFCNNIQCLLGSASRCCPQRISARGNMCDSNWDTACVIRRP